MIKFNRNAIIGAAAVFLASAPVAAISQEIEVNKVVVIERGVFRGRDEGRPVAESRLGAVANVRDTMLLQSTTTIRARRSLRFGVRYRVNGTPNGAEIALRLVTRFPDPGLPDPVTGGRLHESAYEIRASIGEHSYRGFTFDQLREIVPGEWIFEFWYGERMIGSQRFCVLEAEPRKLSSEPPADCETLIGQRNPRDFASMAQKDGE